MTKKLDTAPQKLRGIVLVSLWMLVLPLPGLYRDLRQGLEVVMSPLTTLEWAYYLIGIVCAIGLLRLRPWARIWAVSLFCFNFLWLFGIYYLINGGTLESVIAAQSAILGIAPETLKPILALLVVMYFMWIFGVIFYLLHPKVKLRFHNKQEWETTQLHYLFSS